MMDLREQLAKALWKRVPRRYPWRDATPDQRAAMYAEADALLPLVERAVRDGQATAWAEGWCVGVSNFTQGVAGTNPYVVKP